MTPSQSMESVAPGRGSIVVSSMVRPLEQLAPGQLLIDPPWSLTRRTVTLGAAMMRLAFCSSTSSTTAPGVVTRRSALRVWAGVQSAGTPVVDGVGNEESAGGVGLGVAVGVGLGVAVGDGLGVALSTGLGVAVSTGLGVAVGAGPAVAGAGLAVGVVL